MPGQAGINYTQDEFNERIGGVARDLNVVMDKIGEIQVYLAQFTAGDIDTMFTYTAGEGNDAKTAYTELDQLRTIYEGTANLAVAKDFRTFAKRLYGLGF